MRRKKSNETDSSSNNESKDDTSKQQKHKMDYATATPEERQKIGLIIKNILSEYLDSFLLIGFTPDGLRAFVSNAPTPRDQDALNNFIPEIIDLYFSQQEIINNVPFSDMDDDFE